jgi:hypothetical protein
MRMSWLEGVCVVAIAIAALQVTVREPDARLFVPPPLPAAVLARVSLTAPAPADIRSHRLQPPTRSR